MAHNPFILGARNATIQGRCHACSGPLLLIIQNYVFVLREPTGKPHRCKAGDFPTFEEIGRLHVEQLETKSRVHQTVTASTRPRYVSPPATRKGP